MPPGLRASRVLAGIVVFSVAPLASAAEPTAPDLRFFETRIRPLLVEKCVKCHGPDKQKSDLRLDTADGVVRGGGSGVPLVVKDKPETSLLLRAVRHDKGVEPMPPDGKLTAAQIADLTAWVTRGAPFPKTVAKADADKADHWAFRPLPREVLNPKPQSPNPLDGFVLGKLEANGLGMSPTADRRTLIRRATLDLIGLPPTPDEVEAFVAESEAKPLAAYEKLIDRLLASPHYGERWGRHWLDVARYADSNGLDENIAHGNAWRYRDYVIAAFNADTPYDRFLREQIAGDLLPADTPAARHRQLTATGFLALGPKVLAEVDEKKMELDIVDEQIDTLGRTVMGLTLGCCRCHDHKFDPLPQADYYGLAGIFVSTKTMDSFTKIAKWHENEIATPTDLKRKADHDAAVARLNERIKALTGKADDTSKAELKKLQAELAAVKKAAPEVPSAMGVTDGKVLDVPVLRRGNHLTPAAVVPRHFPVVLAGEKQAALPTNHSGRLELAKWLTSPDHPLTARVMVNRVWRWHFGSGLVKSVDNFGLLGDKPTHPELLDWLARDFVKSGWSVKHLHRRIMLSATYRQSSASNPAAVATDPENRLLWRANVRRLEAEAIRDSLLAAGGLLDRTAGGPAITHVKNREFLFDHTSKDGTTYTSVRRAVYLPVIRNNLYDVFQLFDAPDAAVPTGDRPTTTVATQALFFLNSDLAGKAADALAAKLLARADLDDAGRVRALYATAYGRPPTVKEIDRVRAALGGIESEFATKESDAVRLRAKAWAVVCLAVLGSNEFVSVN